MSGKRGHRAWGSIKKQRTKTASYQASFIGPDLRRHYGPHTFANKMNAERWLASEKDYRDRCLGTNERWRSVLEREKEKQATSMTLATYGTKVLEQRKLKDSSRALYQDKWEKLIVPAIGEVAVKDMSNQVVRDWFSSLDAKYATRNAHAYVVLSLICATAVEDGLLLATPCTIKGATSVTAKPKGEPLSVADIYAMANWLGTEDKYRQFRYLVLIAAFCGGPRIGELVELRRKDIVLSKTRETIVMPDGSTVKRCVPEILKVERGATHRQGCTISTTKTEDQRRVDIPALVRGEVLTLLDSLPIDPETLLFAPIHGRQMTGRSNECGHLSACSFNDNVLKRAARGALKRTDVSPHSLRHFATTLGNHAGVPMKENMARTGHKSKQVHIDYIDRSTNAGKEMADRISDYAATELAKVNQSDENNAKTA